MLGAERTQTAAPLEPNSALPKKALSHHCRHAMRCNLMVLGPFVMFDGLILLSWVCVRDVQPFGWFELCAWLLFWGFFGSVCFAWQSAKSENQVVLPLLSACALHLARCRKICCLQHPHGAPCNFGRVWGAHNASILQLFLALLGISARGGPFPLPPKVL